MWISPKPLGLPLPSSKKLDLISASHRLFIWRIAMSAGLALFLCYVRNARSAAPKTLREVRTELVRRTFPKASGYSNMDDPDIEGLQQPDPPSAAHRASDRAPLKQPNAAARGAGR